jgi:hypothetical protein
MSGWISVKDRMPEPNTVVLVYSNKKGVVIDFFDSYLLTGGEQFLSSSDVTHWMPLPEPPKESDICE